MSGVENGGGGIGTSCVTWFDSSPLGVAIDIAWAEEELAAPVSSTSILGRGEDKCKSCKSSVSLRAGVPSAFGCHVRRGVERWPLSCLDCLLMSGVRDLLGNDGRRKLQTARIHGQLQTWSETA